MKYKTCLLLVICLLTAVSGVVGETSGIIVENSNSAVLIDLVLPQFIADNIVLDVEPIISLEKSKGFDVTEAESLLSEAELAFNEGDYKRALELASNARILALDIDQDGVINDEDFAPTIKNIYIYICVGIIIAFLRLNKYYKYFLNGRNEKRNSDYVKYRHNLDHKHLRDKQKGSGNIKRLVEINNLVFETEKLIKNAIFMANDPMVLSGLKILQIELFNLSQDVKSKRISCADAKTNILNLRGQVEILSARKPGEEQTPKETYYDLLGINPNALQEEIKRAYRNKMKEYHPDKFESHSEEWVKKHADEMCKKINEAYEVVGDIDKRKDYDREIDVDYLLDVAS